MKDHTVIEMPLLTKEEPTPTNERFQVSKFTLFYIFASVSATSLIIALVTTIIFEASEIKHQASIEQNFMHNRGALSSSNVKESSEYELDSDAQRTLYFVTAKLPKLEEIEWYDWEDNWTENDYQNYPDQSNLTEFDDYFTIKWAKGASDPKIIQTNLANDGFSVIDLKVFGVKDATELWNKHHHPQNKDVPDVGSDVTDVGNFIAKKANDLNLMQYPVKLDKVYPLSGTQSKLHIDSGNLAPINVWFPAEKNKHLIVVTSSASNEGNNMQILTRPHEAGQDSRRKAAEILSQHAVISAPGYGVIVWSVAYEDSPQPCVHAGYKDWWGNSKQLFQYKKSEYHDTDVTAISCEILVDEDKLTQF